jgi:hypothetical protein
MKVQEPSAIRAIVRKPAGFSLRSLSLPTKPPQRAASTARAISAQGLGKNRCQLSISQLMNPGKAGRSSLRDCPVVRLGNEGSAGQPEFNRQKLQECGSSRSAGVPGVREFQEAPGRRGKKFSALHVEIFFSDNSALILRARTLEVAPGILRGCTLSPPVTPDSCNFLQLLQVLHACKSCTPASPARLQVLHACNSCNSCDSCKS